ncbi:Trihelix transcription factor df1, partial [Stylosanthes scabra]|nr:Trihelix transcription factor df1 [Stylosanthes scabra]
KMAELGYERSSKKCKEKFENVYKYHKRTKEGRTGKSDGKTYRFFDQLEALEHQSQTPLLLHHQQSPKPPPPTTAMPLPPPPPTTTHVTTVPSTTIPMVIPSSYQTPPPPPQPQPTNPTTTTTIPISFPSIPTDLLSNSTSSSTSSDETMEGGRRKNRKRKWKEFFHKLMTEVIEKQEELQKRFLEAVEKRERDRMAREESWRLQEMQRINREREILAQERSIAAQKDAAVMSFLQKIAEQHNLGQALNNTISIVPPQPQPQPIPNAAPVQQRVLTAQVVAPVAAQPVVLPVSVPPAVPQVVTSMEMVKVGDNNGEKSTSGSSSRWPKVEVEALIRLRTNMDAKYQENGPKGPLWEEISASMKKLGYNRNPKRCKEKWENINKYFKKVKESNKKRPEDSKTCPYFHQLDALYREKNKLDMAAPKPQSMVAPLMVRPEQQWPPQPMEDAENDPMDEDDDEEEKDIGDEEEDEDDGGSNGNGNGGNNYEIVGGKAAAATASAE